MQPEEPSHALVEEDPAFQRQEWRAERVAWAVGMCLLIAAGLGVFGGGMFTRGRIAGPSGEAEYERSGRWRTPQRLTVRLNESIANPRRVVFDDGFLAGVEIRRITPEPRHEGVRSGGVEFAFDIAASGNHTATVAFDLVPIARGRRHGRINIDDDTAISFSQFIFP